MTARPNGGVPVTADDFDYELPTEFIAQTPIEPRDAARMLVADAVGERQHSTVAALADHLRAGDVLVVNTTKVMAARLLVTKPTGGAVEVFLLEPTGNGREWHALVKPSKRVADGTVLQADGRDLIRVGAAVGDGRRLVEVADDAIDVAGQVPLPPYIYETLDDPGRYQTIFADREGSVAAPTAGLHLSTAVLDSLAEAGVEVVHVELMVGLGTFKPITAERLDDHVMHSERYRVEPEAWQRIVEAERVVAVGTTVVRTLESVAAGRPLEGSTDLFIRRGFEWQVVDVLLTNFHVPKSSLLVLVDAFVGPLWRDIYAEARTRGYRFLSFGDCMLLERSR